MATNDSIQREILPIPGRKPIGPTTYDAKDPETKFPPITPLRPPTGAPNVLFILPQVSVKGEVGRNEQSRCRHTADGKVQKKPIDPPPEQKAQPRGLKGRIVEKRKVDEMKDYIEKLRSLIGNFAPFRSAENAGRDAGRQGSLDVVTINSVREPDQRHELLAGVRFGCKEQTDPNQYHKGRLRPIEPLSQD